MVKKNIPGQKDRPPASMPDLGKSRQTAGLLNKAKLFEDINTSEHPVRGRCQDSRPVSRASTTAHSVLDTSPNQVNLIRDLTHDWLIYHSTHAQKQQPSCIPILIIKIKKDERLSALQAMLDAQTQHAAHCLPSFINTCQINKERQLLNVLLTLYLDARSETATQKKDEPQLIPCEGQISAFSRIPKKGWKAWLRRIDDMIKRPAKKRFSTLWFKRRHFGDTPDLNDSQKKLGTPRIHQQPTPPTSNLPGRDCPNAQLEHDLRYRTKSTRHLARPE